ncbi:class I SAM-dependent rRNA methyltransferase [Pseudofulvimonas gallinarii]|jgi:23S rRNA (cytosine1962-C5)-methyltransferase|uniref:SAM-dependent methyltransferase n=1 Tax=Pseudofulvimonas gallinarii TaxID=634155 RepID=A0A4R3LGL8_9GAMM|nr:class I SAM-dependent rRNA methyltransferase [Pseudofulvimonas gallinarii]TCS99293.1 SAM-dependent methyltransferase [Pseudofulvimonas gallinarii]THD13909.1 rRNA large subunit methyltransferase I [Pseudofulvimonas gallinarii]
MTATLPPLRLKKGEDRRLRHGHPWIYSNQIDTAATPLAGFEPGQLVRVHDARDMLIGIGYINPHSLITVRLLTRDTGTTVDAYLVAKRLRAALALRERMYDQPYYRLVFGESDGLPGLVIDRYGSTLVGQIATAGMEALRPLVEQAVAEVLAPENLVWRNTGGSRAMEKLPEYVEAGIGEVPGTIEAREGDLRFRIDFAHAQKTGWFYDQRGNRDLFARYGSGARVLDVFSYLGGWGLRAAATFAERVVCVDSSLPACEGIEANAALNDLSGKVDTLHADAFDALKALREDGEQFDVIVLDPPAFIKRRKDHAAGLVAYKRLNQQALRMLAPGGLLVTCSCSHHLPEPELMHVVHEATSRAGRNASVLARLQQGPDHPLHPAIVETAYLKGLVCAVA